MKCTHYQVLREETSIKYDYISEPVKNDIELEEQEIIRLMKDRKLWAQHVVAASSTPSTDD